MISKTEYTYIKQLLISSGKFNENEADELLNKCYKTIEQWLKEYFDEQEFNEAFNNKRFTFSWTTHVSSLHEAIEKGFYWDQMPKSFNDMNYYNNLYHQLKNEHSKQFFTVTE